MLKSKKSREELKDKVYGAMFGFAIGDAIGATTEFMRPVQIRRKYGKASDIIGGGWLELPAGQVTDDTEMMLCVANAYHSSVSSAWDFVGEVSKNFVRWLRNGPVDCGGACRIGINRLMLGGGPVEDKTVLGNGALMRALPLAITGDNGLNWEQAKLTHYNDTQKEYIDAYSKLVQSAIYGDASEVSKVEVKHMEPSGHVINTFNNAVWAVQNTKCLEDAILKCVNDGGDADTIAAIAGGLAGAIYGWQNIPSRWLDKLNIGVKRQLEEISDFLVACCHGHVSDV